MQGEADALVGGHGAILFAVGALGVDMAAKDAQWSKSPLHAFIIS